MCLDGKSEKKDILVWDFAQSTNFQLLVISYKAIIEVTVT